MHQNDAPKKTQIIRGFSCFAILFTKEHMLACEVYCGHKVAGLLTKTILFPNVIGMIYVRVINRLKKDRETFFKI